MWQGPSCTVETELCSSAEPQQRRTWLGLALAQVGLGANCLYVVHILDGRVRRKVGEHYRAVAGLNQVG